MIGAAETIEGGVEEGPLTARDPTFSAAAAPLPAVLTLMLPAGVPSSSRSASTQDATAARNGFTLAEDRDDDRYHTKKNIQRCGAVEGGRVTKCVV